MPSAAIRRVLLIDSQEKWRSHVKGKIDTHSSARCPVRVLAIRIAGLWILPSEKLQTVRLSNFAHDVTDLPLTAARHNVLGRSARIAQHRREGRRKHKWEH